MSVDEKLTHLSLFSGIGGLDIAAEWAGFKTIAFVERDPYCQRVLAKHWPGVPIFDDVCKVTADTIIGDGSCREVQEGNGVQPFPNREADAHKSMGDGRANFPIGLLSGGFPCQPHSVAGKRQASLDERDLWGECVRITDELRPRWCVFENVPGLLTSERGTFFARVLGDLASLGYRVGWGVWGANDVGAVHKRDRVFIVAHSKLQRTQERRSETNREMAHCGTIRETACDERTTTAESSRAFGTHEDVADAGEVGLSDAAGHRKLGRDFGLSERCDFGGGGEWECSAEMRWESEPEVGRVAHGVPRRVDRLRALGNAVVPQQAYPLFKAIAEIERDPRRA